jgi:HPt (histidine-containing phosphotransfer) domain-containing protein
LWIEVCYENHANGIPTLEGGVESDVSSQNQPLISVYANDAAVADILPLFISNVPKYLENLTNHIRSGDWAMAARVCHDLKGTAGGYGYPDIGAVAKALEAEVKGARSLENLERYLTEARILCKRAQLGLPATEEPAP